MARKRKISGSGSVKPKKRGVKRRVSKAEEHPVVEGEDAEPQDVCIHDLTRAAVKAVRRKRRKRKTRPAVKLNFYGADNNCPKCKRPSGLTESGCTGCNELAVWNGEQVPNPMAQSLIFCVECDCVIWSDSTACPICKQPTNGYGFVGRDSTFFDSKMPKPTDIEDPGGLGF